MMPPADGTWARVDASLTCASCGGQSPVASLETGGTSRCGHCGMGRPLLPQAWGSLLAQIHDVADLAGHNPWIQQAVPGSALATQNPYGHVGVSVACHDLSAPGMAVRITPAAPTCERCGGALDVRAGETILSRCTACGATATYAPPTQARALYPALQAVFDPTHRIDAQAPPGGGFHVKFSGPSPTRGQLAGPQGTARPVFVPSPATSDAGVGFVVIVIAIIGGVLAALIGALAQ